MELKVAINYLNLLSKWARYSKNFGCLNYIAEEKKRVVKEKETWDFSFALKEGS